MANKIKLEIVSPTKVVYTTEVNMLIVRSTDGELGILPKHAPLVTGLVPHAMRVVNDDGEQLIAVSGGFMEVQPTKITVLAATAELPINIDIIRAQKAYDRARERIQAFQAAPPPKGIDIDMNRAHAAMDRAIARLKATKTSIGK